MTTATLTRGQPHDLLPLFQVEALRKQFISALLIISIGASLYGFSVGFWRSPKMAIYVALKTPLLLFSTLLITGFLNGVLSLLFGTGLGFRQSLLCQLLTFSVAAIVLGSLAPLTFFLALEAPSAGEAGATNAHAFYLLIHTAIVGGAGIVAVVRLFALLRHLTPHFSAARLTFLSWLVSNALVGSQLSYLMRPFFGSPGLKVELLRPDPFNGTFFNAVWRALTHLLPTPLAFFSLFLLLLGALVTLNRFLHPKNKNHSNSTTTNQ